MFVLICVILYNINSDLPLSFVFDQHEARRQKSGSGGELFQESNIIFTEEPDVCNAIFQHGRSFDTHPKRITTIFLRINIAVLKHFRVNHPAAKDFKPTGVLTNCAALALAKLAAYIHFRAWFSKGKITWPEAHLDILTIHFLYKVVKRLL